MPQDYQDFVTRCERATKVFKDAYDAETALLFSNEPSKDTELKNPPVEAVEPIQQPDYSADTLYQLAKKGGTDWDSKLDEINKKFKELYS